MTVAPKDNLTQTEQMLRQDNQSPKAYFEAAEAAHNAGRVDKATRYLRMAINSHNYQLLNQFDIKALGDSKNA